ncbi:MAG: NUMOD4 domain-containing protein [archaeon]
MNDEEFKRIPEFENYLVSNCGRVYNEDTGRYLKPSPNSTTGNLRVGLTKNKACHYFYVSRLMFSVFIGEIPNGWIIYCIDENPLNMYLDNLDIMEKAKYASYHQQKEQVEYKERNRNIRYEYNELKKSVKELAEKYGVSKSLINHIVYNHIDFDPNYVRTRMPMSKNVELKKEILEKYKYKTQLEIAEDYGIAQSCVCLIINSEL